MSSAKTEIEAIMADYPDLTRNGFVVYERRKTCEQVAAEVASGRTAMLFDESIAEFTAARVWLRQFAKQEIMNERGTSYGLKHAAKPDIGYTSNGMFIAAAVAEGFQIERAHGSPNVYLNISDSAWNKQEFA